jgi:hypothetical protein
VERQLPKPDLRHETPGFPCAIDAFVQLVDFLEGQALGFVDEEVDEEDADEAVFFGGRKMLVRGFLKGELWWRESGREEQG